MEKETNSKARLFSWGAAATGALILGVFTGGLLQFALIAGAAYAGVKAYNEYKETAAPQAYTIPPRTVEAQVARSRQPAVTPDITQSPLADAVDTKWRDAYITQRHEASKAALGAHEHSVG